MARPLYAADCGFPGGSDARVRDFGVETCPRQAGKVALARVIEDKDLEVN